MGSPIAIHMVMAPICFEDHRSIGNPTLSGTVTRVSNYEPTYRYLNSGQYGNGTLWLWGLLLT